jgi:hypothetical protein
MDTLLTRLIQCTRVKYQACSRGDLRIRNVSMFKPVNFLVVRFCYIIFGKLCFPSVKCVFSAKFCQLYEIIFFSKIQHMKCNEICEFWSLEYKCRKSSWTMLLSLETFCGYLKKKTWEKFGRICWYSVNSTNFVILLENFMKFSTSQNWKKTSILEHCVFLGAKYHYLVTKRTGDPTNVFWRKNSKTLPYLEAKKVQIPRFWPELQAYH